MRCFVAFDLPNSFKDKLEGIQKELYSENEKIRWVAKKNLHCTLKFLGNVEDKSINDIKNMLNEVKYKKFKTKLNKIGIFPSKSYIRVVFVELNPANDVMNLQNEIENCLISVFPRDERFHSHITLGRVKLVKDKEKFLKKLEKIKLDKEFEVKEFKLYKSILSRDGPKYEVMQSYDLSNSQ